MQTHTQNHKDSRCVTLASPRNLYNYLLLHIYEKFGKREKDLFEFCFRDDLPCSVLESGDPLKWFKTLEQRGKLSWNDVNSMVDFLKQASCDDLVSAARHYQARIGVIQFFQRHLQAKLPKFCLDDKLKKKWGSEQQLPNDYFDRCEEFFFRQNSDESRDQVRCLFSKGVVLLVNSCSGPSSDSVQSACFKLLYLADLFYKRFKKMIVDDKELLNIKPSRITKLSALGNRRRMSGRRRRRSPEPVEVRLQLSYRSEVIYHYNVLLMCMSLQLVILTSLLGWGMGVL
ncbi:predicted protein [Paramuricea clavata]|uniref:Uncharacterized protein n=1 Tax=Paramuricea clavata TaxID=317549 RepID=A0A6S7HQS3_PARCT|nr:predicted protein [Paramuricea clavata]